MPPASCKLSSRRTTFSISQKPYSWNWDVLATWARSLSAINKTLSWKAPQRQAFLRRLFDFLTPDILLLSLSLHPTAGTVLPGDTKGACAPLSSFYASLLSHKRLKSSKNDVLCLPNLAWTAQAWTESWAAGVLLGGLLPHLTLYPADSLPGQLLHQFLQSIRQCLQATLEYEGAVDVHAGAEPPPPPTSNLHLLFQTVSLQKLCSPLLLFAVGRVASCKAGYELLTSLGLTDAVFQLLQRSTLAGVYRPVEVQINLNRRTLLLTKILLASSNFASNEGLGQRLLVTAFRYGTEVTKSIPSEYCSGSGDPTVLAIVNENSGDHPASGAAGDSEKCRLLHLPLLLLTPEAGLTGHRVFASVLSSSAIFIRFATSSPLASNLVYWMLSAWRQVTIYLQIFIILRIHVGEHMFSAIHQRASTMQGQKWSVIVILVLN
ncbi:unnamed protein product [Dibothriocephalus latus]|uniref:Uncharacterized protein n=1 Tax=Dibothriocephalus latus TaxID=60516 RepID=A0A3P7L635_DIBLA|nr:unnamed protein product [Dibothriocephalus latus]